MGTWSTGPFDNDTAADLIGNVTDTDRDSAQRTLSEALVTLTHLDPNPDSHISGIDLNIALEEGIAAAAYITDAATGIRKHTATPYADSLPLNHLGDITPVDIVNALHAIENALALQTHPDAPEWTDQQTADNHRTNLEEILADLTQLKKERITA